MSQYSPYAPPPSGGRLIFWLGLLTAVAGVFAYGAQMSMGKLVTPWYAPILATLGAGMVLLSFSKRGTAWRALGFIFSALVAGFAWWALLYYVRLPAYTGPVAVGNAFPTFVAARADGTPFTRASFEGEQDTVLVFFRGHW